MAMRIPSSSSFKRSISPIPGPVKRHKSERADSEGCASDAHPLPLTATYGVEAIKYPPGTRVSAFSQGDFETMVRERQHLLFTQGRKVVGLPQVFDDGIVMHWISDPCSDLRLGPASLLPSILSAPQPSVLPEDSILPFPKAQTSTSGPADAVVENKGRYVNLSQTAGPSEIEIISFKLAGGNQVTKNEHAEENHGSHKPHAHFKSGAIAYGGVSGQDVDEKISSSEDIASLSRSRAVSSRRDQAMAELCGDWSSMRSSSVAPSSDDDRSSEPADVSEVAEASSSRTEVRAPLTRTVGALRGQKPTSQRSTAAARNGVPSQPRQRINHYTFNHKISTEDRSRSDVSLRSRRAISLSSESSCSDQEVVKLPALKRVPLPKTPYGRSRRLLIPASVNLPLVAISMRADAQFISRRDQYRLTLNSLPNPGVQQHVEDACVVGDTVVLGFNSGPSQVTFLPVTTEAPCRVDSRALPHVNSPRTSRSSGGGVRCLAAMNAATGSVEFFTGGHDRRIYKWSADAQSLEEPTVTKIDVFLDSGVSAMAYRHDDNLLVSSDTKKIYVTDLTRSHTPRPVQVSNDVNQIHVHPQIPHLTLLEVRHLDHQMLLFDRRMGGFNKAPCCTFGYRDANAKFQQSYTKGSIHHTLFVRGHQDGAVVLWDFRNVKNIVTKKQSQLTKSVVHTVISDGRVVTFGDGVVTFLNDFLHS